MIGSLSSIYSRTGYNSLSFNVDENSYNPDADRVTTQDNALDGTVIISDWGFAEGNRKITLSNIILTKDEYEALIDFKEDNTATWVWAYKNSIWKVVIKNARGTPAGVDYNASITLLVVERYNDVEQS